MNKLYLSLLLVALTLLSCDNNESRLYRIQANGLFGFIDSIGNVIIEPQYKYVGPFSKDGYACVISNITLVEEISPSSKLDIPEVSENMDSCIHIKYGYINKKNELVVDTTNLLRIHFNSINDWGGSYLIEFAHKYMANNLGFRENALNKLILNDGLLVFQDKDSKLFGYKDIEGNIKIEPKYELCSMFSNGVAVVKNKKDQVKIDNFSDSSITESLNSTGVIDINGNMVVKDYAIINDYTKDGLTWALSVSFSLDDDNGFKRDWVLIDKKGDIKKGPISNIAHIYNNQEYPIIAMDMGFMGVYYSFLDENGEYLTDFNGDKQLSLSLDGSERSELFKDVTRFSSGLAGIIGYNSKGESAWLFYDKNLDPVSEPYDSLLAFSEGLAAVKQLTYLDNFSSHMGKWGFISMDADSTLNLSIPYSFSECGSFAGGLAYFMNYGTTFDVEGYINKQGKIIWQTKRKK